MSGKADTAFISWPMRTWPALVNNIATPATRRGFAPPFRRVHRLWKAEHLQVPKKQRRRRRLPGGSENSCIRHKAAQWAEMLESFPEEADHSPPTSCHSAQAFSSYLSV
jgi:hypothetical protein